MKQLKLSFTSTGSFCLSSSSSTTLSSSSSSSSSKKTKASLSKTDEKHILSSNAKTSEETSLSSSQIISSSSETISSVGELSSQDSTKKASKQNEKLVSIDQEEGKKEQVEATTTISSSSVSSKRIACMNKDDNNNEISEYERLRNENIMKNLEFLESLGLSSEVAPNNNKLNNVSKNSKKTRKRKISSKPIQACEPIRRSRRLLGGSKPEGVERSIEENVVEETVPPAVYEDSLLPQYSMEEEDLKEEPEDGLCTFTRITDSGKEWCDPSLKKIYSLDWNTSQNCFAAGGHQGRVSVFGLSKMDEPLMSFKASKGWCSSVKFYKPGCGKPLLLTTSNDSTIILWDCSKVESTFGTALQAGMHDSIHSSGIFSMDTYDDKILTGSKDCTVGISTVREDGSFQTIHTFENTHSSVVKTVAWRDENIFASSGNDLSLVMYDLRTREKVMSIEDAHPFAINSISWRNKTSHQLLSTSFSPVLKMFDMRKNNNDTTMKTTVSTFNGHTLSTRCKSIYHPIFIDSGKKILTSGDNNDFITVYDVENQSVISRGDVGFQASTISKHPMDESKLIVSFGKTLKLLKLK